MLKNTSRGDKLGQHQVWAESVQSAVISQLSPVSCNRSTITSQLSPVNCHQSTSPVSCHRTTVTSHLSPDKRRGIVTTTTRFAKRCASHRGVSSITYQYPFCSGSGGQSALINFSSYTSRSCETLPTIVSRPAEGAGNCRCEQTTQHHSSCLESLCGWEDTKTQPQHENQHRLSLRALRGPSATRDKRCVTYERVKRVTCQCLVVMIAECWLSSLGLVIGRTYRQLPWYIYILPFFPCVYIVTLTLKVVLLP